MTNVNLFTVRTMALCAPGDRPTQTLSTENHSFVYCFGEISHRETVPVQAGLRRAPVGVIRGAPASPRGSENLPECSSAW